MAANRERTFIAIKPDGVQRGLVGKIIKRFEQRGFKLVALKMCAPGKAHMEKHYADLSKKPFFRDLVDYMISGPIVCMVWEGLNAVKCGRMMLGETNPQASLPGSIRGDFSIQVGRNICHGSDSVASANHEIALWFKKEELVNWESAMYTWIYEEPAAPAPASSFAKGDYPELNAKQLAEFDAFLLDHSYASGFSASQDDVFRFLQIKLVPAELKNVQRWWKHISSFESEFDALPGVKNQPPQVAQAPAAVEEEEEDDDDVDLFGDDDEEDDEAEKIKAARIAEYNAKKQAKEEKKGKVIAKSNIILDIKPWDDETDMAEMESLIRSIEMDGLLWGTAKLVPIGYGIKKIQITTVVEDDKVSTDDLEESITAFEDFVQSVDIVAFNKI